MTDPAPSPQPLPSLFARVIGIIVSPKATFERVVQTPKILGVLAVVTIASAIGASAFTFTAAGQQAAVDFSAQQIERFTGQPPTDAQMAAIEKQAPIQAYISSTSTLVVLPLVIAIEAGLLFLIFNVVLGGTATFRQVYAVSAHSTVITILGLLVAVPMQFARGAISMTGPANLGVLFPMLAENSVLSSFLGTIDFFRVWWVITISIGLGVLYRRPTRGIALTLFGLYLVIALSVSFLFHGR
jgi:membrane protein, antimicrobial resistance system